MLFFLSTAEEEDRTKGEDKTSAGQSSNIKETKFPPPGMFLLLIGTGNKYEDHFVVINSANITRKCNSIGRVEVKLHVLH